MTSVTVYHFSQAARITSILREGIRRGCIPTPAGDLITGYQWMTVDPRWSAQGWNTNHAGYIPDRIAVRFTVVIPPTHAGRLMAWNEYARCVLRWPLEFLRNFNAEGNSDGKPWRIYQGRIRAAWITGHALKEQEGAA
jgi:hypothetical protein